MLSCNIGNYLIKRQSESYIIIYIIAIYTPKNFALTTSVEALNNSQV